MEQLRKPFIGVWNIIRFNWHFYVIAVVIILIALYLSRFLPQPLKTIGYFAITLILITTIISLLVSYYVYDLSGLYNLKWLDETIVPPTGRIININAGFDETSKLLKNKFNQAEFIIFDFYDPIKHTEISIRRARKAYPPFTGTKQVNTSQLTIPDFSADIVFVILSAHEIRNEFERDLFFQELERILKQTGKIILVEHLRDVPNFLAYNIGFFHFMPKASWYRSFAEAKLRVLSETKITPFITAFILQKHGNTP